MYFLFYLLSLITIIGSVAKEVAPLIQCTLQRRCAMTTVPIPGTIFEAIGGFDPIERIVVALYARIGKHPDLIPIFPEDLAESARKQELFLIQFFGGPQLYLEDRGHPMLRKRHLPFEITPKRKDAWLACMKAALDEAKIKEPYRTAIYERLVKTANHMINTPE